MGESDYAKTIILTMIKDRKELLFGSLSYPITNEERHAAWKEIHLKAKSLGVVKESTRWEYIRDTTWANWKRRTLEKRDKKNQTGKGGGRARQYTAIDELVLDIVGRESPLITGLPVPESMMDEELSLPSLTPSPVRSNNAEPPIERSNVPVAPAAHRKSQGPVKPKPKVMLRLDAIRRKSQVNQHKVPTDASRLDNNNNNEESLDNEVIVVSSLESVKRPAKRSRKEFDGDNEQREKKVKIQLDLMEIDLRTKAIQLYKLEKKFGLPASKFTKEFHDLLKESPVEEEAIYD